uniref:SH3 domain-containing protein n=1 Tax=Desulfovibrio sp. U5L TaxID=596152 RepID=I2Q5Q0_9BACT
MRSRRLAVALVLALTLCGVGALAAKVMSVAVRDGQVRETPSFLGKIVGKASYGQTVDVSDEQGDWAKVSVSGGPSGWMHRSALAAGKLALSSGSGASENMSGKEMALAGKGFSAQVEADYRRGHGGNYAAIDAMERQSYSPAALLAFLSQGDVKPQGGGR